MLDLADVSRMQDIVKDSDTIFILNDMRKYRWLPFVMDRALGKTLIDTAQVLDGWLVMQHGVSGRASGCLGCYFYSP